VPRLTTRPPRIFLSYRRADSAEATGRIFERLADAFGEHNVFMDTERARGGEEFWPSILAALDRSDRVVVVVGGAWMDDDGRRRLLDPTDFVRRELARALAVEGKVVPALVEGARMPSEAELPEDVRSFARVHAATIRHESFGKDVSQLVRALDHRIVSRVVLVCGMVVAALAGMAWVRGFDAATVAMEDWTMAIGDTVAPARLASEVVLVGIDAKSEQTKLGKFGPGWRRWHARLVDIASSGGARAVAFDMSFATPSEFDEAFAAAIRRARDRGTRVFAASETPEGEVAIVAPLAETMTGIGLATIGKKLGRASTVVLAALRFPEVGPPVPRPALALFATHPFDGILIPDRGPSRLPRWLGAARADVTIYGGLPAGSVTIGGSWRETLRETPGSRAYRVNDEVVHLMLRLSPLEALRRAPARLAYEDIVSEDQPLPEDTLEEKIVLVGRIDDPRDLHATTLGFREERRAGVELHADAVSTILQGAGPRPIGEAWTVLLTAVMGWLGWRLRHAGGRFASPMVIVAVVTGFIGVAVACYLFVPILIGIPFPLAAFLTAYLAAGRPVRAPG